MISGIVGWILAKVKWLLLIAAVGGPIMAFISWNDAQHRQKVAKDGIEATAAIDGATRTKRKRGGTSYTVNLKWKDKNGKDMSADKVAVSNAYANQIIMGDRLRVATTRIKYLPAAENVVDAETGVIITADNDRQETTDGEMVYLGSGAGLVGILGFGAFWFFGRRREEQQPAQA
ncbi:hypothetical protein GJW-30_1_03173 [Variibacter gotjawalensis]|uniref:DUF3592 domain-containing protein n=1 Tax=Variibacter gotjawalensis TaxID=1333996 RepID=A0A0S3PXG2_9BRAD|nr:hypothetical protein [Variibacter gotjawalensis]NIK46457.1 hypothetical protein [Variibacter gotjawalensis]RZS48367.1 hypothetical protein EV661_0777 [Variibacter gotjawalensis]BAT60625.1 hypothetical protein GJW-30_1_03173 [Variibacter gotjawalensis]